MEPFASLIREIPDFPEPGVVFKDIAPILSHPGAFAELVKTMAEPFRDAGITQVAGIEARGFTLAAPIALALGAGFIPIRKPGKLPFDTHAFHYELEYGADTLEMHVDGVLKNQNVLVVDDLLATGGTVDACCRLVENCGASVAACVFLIELMDLKGREKIAPREAVSLIQY